MRHVFKATKLGWGREQEGIWFDADDYTKEQAVAQFVEYHDETQRGFPYTGYIYKGQKYYKVVYLGLFEDDKMPLNDSDLYRIK